MVDTILHVRPPSDFSELQKQKFCSLVSEGGEVADGLRTRVNRAAVLLMVERADTICAVAAIKRPHLHYRDQVFEKAGYLPLAEKFDFEIGWIFVSQVCRGEGLSSDLVTRALDVLDGKEVFATSRSNNLPMQHVLKKNGFRQIGAEYASRQDPESNLCLLVTNTDFNT